MRTLSATEAISPAFSRTKAILFQPFQWGRSWKLAVTAYLTMMGAFFLPTPLIFLIIPTPAHRPASLAALTGVFGLVFSAVMFVFFYIGARLEFVLFDIVLLKEKFVAPSWRRHAPHTGPWIGFKLILSLFLTVLSAPPLYYAFRSLFQQMTQFAQIKPGQPPPPEFFTSIILFYAIIGIPFGFMILASSLLTNFVLPSIALENTTVTEGFRRFSALCAAEPGPMALFVAFKILLAIAGGVAMQVAVFILEIIVGIPFVLIAVLGGLLLHSAGPAGQALMLVGGIVLGVIFFFCFFYGVMLIMGFLHVFFQAYALYFLGGRYPTLGDLLEPPPSPVSYYTPPPSEPPPAFNPITPTPPEPAV